MKKLLILSVVLMLSASATGCRCGRWLWRGAAWNPGPPAVTLTDPSPPFNPCDPCETAPPALTPGPAPYVETPTQ